MSIGQLGTTSGNYTVTLQVTDNLGATGSDNFTITVLPNDVPPNDPPSASFTSDTTFGLAPLTVVFSSSASDNDGTISTYDWDFGDGTTSGVQNPTHTYTTPGNYSACLSVIQEVGKA